MASIDTYQIKRPWDGAAFYTMPEPKPEPQIQYGQQGFVLSDVYEKGMHRYDSKDPIEVAEAKDAEFSRMLHTSVVLQTLLDICNPKYLRSGEIHPIRYDAIAWIEGRTQELRADRDEVLDHAGIEPWMLLEGYRRIKEAGFDLYKVIDAKTLTDCHATILELSTDEELGIFSHAIH
jgi:hypothetical protein